MKKILIAASIAACMALVGCGKSEIEPTTKWNDQGKRIKLFQECLLLVPAGPQTTTYNDWDDVVKACSDAAYYQSIVIKPCDGCVPID